MLKALKFKVDFLHVFLRHAEDVGVRHEVDQLDQHELFDERKLLNVFEADLAADFWRVHDQEVVLLSVIPSAAVELQLQTSLSDAVCLPRCSGGDRRWS